LLVALCPLVSSTIVGTRGGVTTSKHKAMKQQLAPVTATIAPAFVAQRPIESILRDVTINQTTGAVTINKGQQLTADEIGLVVLDNHQKSEVQGLVRANFVRLSRGLPPVKDGDKETPAIDYVKEKLRRAMGDGAFYNMLQVADAIDVIEINGLGDVSPSLVKDAVPMLRALGAMPPAKAKLELRDRLKVTASKAKPIVDALKSKVSQTKLEEIGKGLIERRARQTKDKDKDGDKDKAPKVEHTPATVNNALVTARGQWELAVKGGVKVEDMRNACKDELEKLALLGGFALVPLAKK